MQSKIPWLPPIPFFNSYVISFWNRLYTFYILSVLIYAIYLDKLSDGDHVVHSLIIVLAFNLT